MAEAEKIADYMAEFRVRTVHPRKRVRALLLAARACEDMAKRKQGKGTGPGSGPDEVAAWAEAAEILRRRAAQAPEDPR